MDAQQTGEKSGARDAQRTKGRNTEKVGSDTGAKWTEPGADYPRPQMKRQKWMSLNGPWKFSFDDERKWLAPNEVSEWKHTIQVPFAPETNASGIGDTRFHSTCWYERSFVLERPKDARARRVFLHFGAVDYAARVWVNGRFVGTHEGGHTPFCFDVTDTLNEDSNQTVSVWVEDEPLDLAKPRGKQDWQLEPHSIWYPRTTGIWQTVWVEEVSTIHIERLRWDPHLERWEIGCEVWVSDASSLQTSDSKEISKAVGRSVLAKGGEPLRLAVRLTCAEQLLAHDVYEVVSGEVHRRIALSDPGIDDYRNELLWSPEKPTLIHAELELRQGDVVFDRVESYTALRSVGLSRDRFMLNGRPYYLRLVLDQGYWPDTFMTPPSTEACRQDIELVKAAGFNGVRKHQKIESPWFHYWADRLGLLVWEEMPSAYRFTQRSIERITKEWIEVIDRDFNHPCLCVWVPFNESWGVPDLAMKVAHQNAVRALYHLTKTLDPNRLVVGNDGWESLATDIIGIHDYDDDPTRLLERYGGSENVAETLQKRRPAGRLLTLADYPSEGQPIMLTECGGIAFTDPNDPGLKKNWGYDTGKTPEDLERKYRSLMSALHRIDFFSGFCYTQFTDTFQEANGLFYGDRRPKFPIERMRAMTRGNPMAREEQVTLQI